MKIVLLQDNKTLGKKGDIVKVADGFAFNNLFPRGIAKPATEHVLAEVAREKEHKAKELEAFKKKMKMDAEKIDKKRITIHAKAKGDKLFGSVSSKEITKAIKDQHDIAIDEKMVILDSPIKELSAREIVIDYGSGIKAHVVVTIVAK